MKEFSKCPASLTKKKCFVGDQNNHTSPGCNSAHSGATRGASGSGAVCHMTASTTSTVQMLQKHD